MYPWHLQAGVCRVGQSSTAAVDADRDTADQVAHANRDTSPEERESGVVVGSRVKGIAADGLDLGREDDGHDNAVDSDDLAKDDGDQVLGPYPGRLDTSTENGATGDENTPANLVSKLLVFSLGFSCWHTMQRPPRTDRCRGRCPCLPTCTAKRSRGIVQPGSDVIS